MAVPLNRQAGEPSKLHASDEDRKLGSPNISEVLRRRDIAPKGGRRAVSVYIVLPAAACQHLSPQREPEIGGLHWAGPRRLTGSPPPPKRGKSRRTLRIVRMARARHTGESCAGPGPTPHCGHIPRPFLGIWWEVSVRGNPRQGRSIRDPSGVTRNRRKQSARTVGNSDRPRRLQ